MACSKCKQKAIKEKNEQIKHPTKPLIELDRVITWVMIGWFFLGCYGLYSLIKHIFG